MKQGIIIVGLIIISIFTCGCMICDYLAPGEYQPFYNTSHQAAKNLTIELGGIPHDRFTVSESGINNVTIMIRTRGTVVVGCGVNFMDDNGSQQVNIDIMRRGIKEFIENNWPALIDIEVPPGTNYTVKYVQHNPAHLTYVRPDIL
jgi:hypothetical protein